MKLLIAILTALIFTLSGNTSEAANTTLNLRFLHEGFYKADIDKMIKPMSVTVLLRKATPPYNVISSSPAVVDSFGYASVNFSIPISNVNYFIVVSGWNLITTWSGIPVSFVISGVTTYDFTTNDYKAFGDNMIKLNDIPERWAMYAGDISQDGCVDIGDVFLTDNAQGTTGNVIQDLTGDGISEVVDVDDLVLVINNANTICMIIP